jgi:2,3-bisphosphoglycerate-dependent phosphoglycerate mutase
MSNPGGSILTRAAPDTEASSSVASSRLLFVRHGESTWNRERRIQGQLDPPLTERGEIQAGEVAERLTGHEVVGFYSSDLRRCRQTARPIVEAVGMEPVLVPELREIALGEWQGKTGEELGEEYPELWDRWTREPSWDMVPEGERAADFERRTQRAVDRMFVEHPRGDILCVTHGGVIQVTLSRVVGSSVDAIFPFLIENCSLTVVQRSPRGLVVTAVNDTCHLS